MEISVVVVTWNGRALVEECLESLHSQVGAPSMEVIVVDNDSCDGTPQLIAEKYPDVRLFRNTENYGFARANNVGIRHSTGQYLFLINSDVVVPPDCVREMYEYMKANPAVGLSGPKMLYPDGRVGRSTMRYPTLWNTFQCATGLDTLLRGRIANSVMMHDFDHQTTREVEVLTGWFWVVRRAALEEVGVLDERFFIYGEDVDWCARFRKLHWRVVFYAGAYAFHHCGGSSQRDPVRFYIEMYRANLQYWTVHSGKSLQRLYFLILIAHHSLRVFAYSALLVVRWRRRKELAFKVHRSAKCLQWLLRWDPNTTAGPSLDRPVTS